jgi:thiol-disulfide isomerase/thioredoxin
MKKHFPRSPYLWTAILGVAVVVFAWVGRENYRPVIAGEDAPGYNVLSLAGEEVSLDDFRGRVVLLNIWATWCAPCKEEMPSMQRLYEELEGTDFEILAVSVDAPFGEVDAFGRAGGNLDAFTAEMGLTFPIFQDPSGGIQRAYQTTGVPESFVVGRDGIIYKKLAGPTDWDAPVNVELIRRLLAS